MTNDLINVENIEREFCIYEVEGQTYAPSYKLQNGKRIPAQWNKYTMFDGVSIGIKASYKYAIDRQREHSRTHRVVLENMMILINILCTENLLPKSLQPKVTEVIKCKVRRADMRINNSDKIRIEQFKRVRLWKHTFRSQIISYLIQKREDILNPKDNMLWYTHRKKFKYEENEVSTYDKMIKVFEDMNTTTTNAITFDQAVENLYNKIMNTMGDDDEV